jgi:uncharacterized protein involved in outer membrane biogenesis
MNLSAIANRNKDFLLSRAESALGRRVSIEKIGVTLLGGIGVRLEHVVIADDPAFSTDAFLTARDLQVNAKLLPLLKKRFEIKRVILRDPEIRIIRNEQGRLNTTTLGAPKGASASGSAGSNTAPSGAAAPLVVSLVNLEGGEVHFSDRSAGLDLKLTQIESHVEELDFNKPIALSLKAAFLAEEPNLKLTGQFGPIGQPVDVKNLAVQLAIELDPLDVATLARAVPSIGKAMPPNLKMSGPLSARIEAAGRPDSVKVDLRIDATQASASLPQFQKTPGIPLVLTSKARVAPPRVTIEGFTLALDKLEAAGSGVYMMTQPPTIDISIESKSIALADWTGAVPQMKPYGLSGTASLSLRIHGPLKPGVLPSRSGKLTLVDARATIPQLPKPISQGRAEITFSGTQAKVSNASARIGGSTVEGSAVIETFTPLTVAYEARSATLALADVRPPNPNAKKPEVLNALAVRGRMVALKEPENRGEATVASGSIANIDVQNLKASYALVGKETRIEHFEVQTLEGTISGSGVMATKGGVPTFDFKTKASNLSILAFLDRLPPATAKFLRGRASLDLNVSGAGKEWPDIQKSVSGSGVAELFDGALVDFNLFSSVVDQISGATGNPNLISNSFKEKYPKLFKSQDTEFNDIKSDFVIENGKLLARNLKLKADEYNVSAKGGLGLDRSLDIDVNLLLSKKLSSDLIQDVKLASYLANANGQIEIPFVLEGTLPKARAKIDASYISKIVEKALVQQGLDVLQKQKGGSELKDLFNKLGGNKKKDAPPDTTRKP